MKEDFLNIEELELPPMDEAGDEEIVSGNNVFQGEAEAVGTLDEVRADVDEEIVVGDINAGEDWQRAVKHLNARIGELEEEVARLAAMVGELRKKSE